MFLGASYFADEFLSMKIPAGVRDDRDDAKVNVRRVQGSGDSGEAAMQSLKFDSLYEQSDIESLLHWIWIRNSG